MQTTDKYLELFQQNREQIGKDDPLFLKELRDTAITAFQRDGFPGRKEERYKYTHLEPVFDGELSFDFQPRKIQFDDEDLFRCDVPLLDSNVLTVLNGYFHQNGEGILARLDNGIIYGGLKEAIAQFPELVEKYLGKNAPTDDEPFVALNTAFSQDGIFLYVPEGIRMERPIQIINLLLSDKNQMVQHRNLLVLERNASAQVIVCDHTLSPHMFLTNSVTEVYTGENADMDLLRLQN